METRRLYAACKRKREVFIKKSITGVSVLIITLIFGIFVSGNLAAAHNNAEESPVTHKYYKSIEITAGDTLWNIAEEYMNESYSSVNEYINEIKRMNELESDNIHDSQFLTIAYYDTEFK